MKNVGTGEDSGEDFLIVVSKEGEMDAATGLFEEFEETILGGFGHEFGRVDDDEEIRNLFGANEFFDVMDLFD
jgi:hypothetical protein